MRCGHCGDNHSTVAEVRYCAIERGYAAAPGLPAEVKMAKPREITEGLWVRDAYSGGFGDPVWKVVRSQENGMLYAKLLTDGKFHFLPGGVRKLARMHSIRLMTKEEAASYGKLYGVCCVCGRTLTNEESIEAGIGPVCAGKFA
jgi:hypothetical protein